MSSQRYEKISDNDHDDVPASPTTTAHDHTTTPSSSPPSFRSRASSPTSRYLLSTSDPLVTDAERTLADTFDDGSDSDNDATDGRDDRQRLMQTPTTASGLTTIDNGANRPAIQRTVTEFPTVETTTSTLTTLNVPARPHTGSTPFNSRSQSNDGVFANLNAKPERGEKIEEQPPSYEAAAADATPPYWETTILAPSSLSASDEVYVDGLPVGSLFSFAWNAMISLSFQFVGFLLTYLLHTTHAAKNGSKAGLGITLVQYGFSMRAGAHKAASGGSPPAGGAEGMVPPQDPNNHDLDPSNMVDTTMAQGAAASAAAASTSDSVTSTNWFAYILMIVGWFLLIRAGSDFIKARRHEQLVLQSPDRGLNVPVVAEGETVETVV